jgi:hypothetical protein
MTVNPNVTSGPALLATFTQQEMNAIFASPAAHLALLVLLTSGPVDVTSQAFTTMMAAISVTGAITPARAAEIGPASLPSATMVASPGPATAA